MFMTGGDVEVVEVRKQTDREMAEMIAKFRTPPGMNWTPLADDIETLLKMRPAIPENVEWSDIEKLATGQYDLCDGYCHDGF